MRNKGRRGLSVLIAFLVLAGIAGVRGASEPQNDFRFSILGDRTGDADAQIYEHIWREMRQFSPDFVINVGDTIQGGNDATAEAEWRGGDRLGGMPRRLELHPVRKGPDPVPVDRGVD